jgi:hypothetical protein
MMVSKVCAWADAFVRPATLSEAKGERATTTGAEARDVHPQKA